MKKMTQIMFGVALFATSSIALAQQTIDRVAVVVNDSVIVESEIEQMINTIKRNAAAEGQQLPDDDVLRVQVNDRLILRELQMQMATRMGIEISDAQLDSAINGIATDQNMSLDELRAEVTSNGSSWSAYRDEVRRQMITSEVQRNAVQRRVYVSPQEIDNLVELIDQSSNQEVEYRLRQILVGIPDGASSSEVAEASRRAESILQRIDDGEDFAQLAYTASAGREALEGGDMGWLSVNEMPSLFADVVSNKREGDILGPLRSGVGFHILKIDETRGLETVDVEEVLARHILIQPSVILSDKRAEEMLNDFYQQIKAGEADFADLAMEHSSDPGSAAEGGDLGWASPDIYADAFKSTLAKLEVGELSKPFRSQFGWHLVELMDRRVQDGTAESKKDRAYQMLFSRKYREELENWQQEIRAEAYIEIVER